MSGSISMLERHPVLGHPEVAGKDYPLLTDIDPQQKQQINNYMNHLAALKRWLESRKLDFFQHSVGEAGSEIQNQQVFKRVINVMKAYDFCVDYICTPVIQYLDKPLGTDLRLAGTQNLVDMIMSRVLRFLDSYESNITDDHYKQIIGEFKTILENLADHKNQQNSAVIHAAINKVQPKHPSVLASNVNPWAAIARLTSVVESFAR